MTLRFYYHPRSTFSRRVHIALLEKQIPFEPIEVDLAAGAHREPGYLSLNPYGRVPAIVDDGFTLYESAAILSYLEATRPTPPLIPADPAGRALVDMHLRLCDGQMARPTSLVIFPKRFLPESRWDVAAMSKARAEVEKHLGIVETQLADSDYLVRGALSLADICYIPSLHFLPLMEISAPPRVAAWRERLLNRPSSLATVPAL